MDQASQSQSRRNVQRRLKKNSQRPISRIQQANNQSNSEYQAYSQQEDIFEDNQSFSIAQKPIRRVSKALSEINVSSKSSGIATKSRQKNKKKQNEGNVFLQEQRIKHNFKQICDPDGFITIDSLGHALNKNQIDFKLRDLADMLDLLWICKDQQPPRGIQQRTYEDEQGSFDISMKLNYEHFHELYKMIRSKK